MDDRERDKNEEKEEQAQLCVRKGREQGQSLINSGYV
jgi:hypothetical protein